MKYKVINDINHNGVSILQGQTVFLSEGQAKTFVELGKIVPLEQLLPAIPVQEAQPSNRELLPEPLPKAERRVAYMVDLPITFEGRQYKPGDIVYLSESEAASFLKPEPLADSIQVHDKPDRFEVLTVDKQGKVLDSLQWLRTPSNTVSLSHWSCTARATSQVMCIDVTVDDAQVLLQATCYWSRTRDFSATKK